MESRGIETNPADSNDHQLSFVDAIRLPEFDTFAAEVYLSRSMRRNHMIVLHAVFPLDPDKRDEALDLITELAEKSRAEPGMIDYRPATDVDDPNMVRFFEQYEDEAAFEAHSQTEHFQEFEAALPDLLAGEPEVTRFEVDSATEMEL